MLRHAGYDCSSLQKQCHTKCGTTPDYITLRHVGCTVALSLLKCDYETEIGHVAKTEVRVLRSLVRVPHRYWFMTFVSHLGCAAMMMSFSSSQSRGCTATATA